MRDGRRRRLNCNRRFFNKIISGQKTADCRLKGPYLKGLKSGELIEFHNDGSTILAQVIGVRWFGSVEDLLRGVKKLSAILPGVACVNEAKTELLRIYPEDQVKRSKGFVVFSFTVLC